MQTADIMIIKTKAVLEAITITAEAILLISIQTGSALMQAVLLVIPAQLVVLPPKIRLLPESKSNRNSSRSGFYWLAER